MHSISTLSLSQAKRKVTPLKRMRLDYAPCNSTPPQTCRVFMLVFMICLNSTREKPKTEAEQPLRIQEQEAFPRKHV